MTVNPGLLIHYAFPLILLIGGFHGIFFYSNLLKKSVAWCAFQLGLTVFLVQGAPSGAPLPNALAIEVAVLTFVVALLLGVLSLKIHQRYKTLDGDEIAGRGSK